MMSRDQITHLAPLFLSEYLLSILKLLKEMIDFTNFYLWSPQPAPYTISEPCHGLFGRRPVTLREEHVRWSVPRFLNRLSTENSSFFSYHHLPLWPVSSQRPELRGTTGGTSLQKPPLLWRDWSELSFAFKSNRSETQMGHQLQGPLIWKVVIMEANLPESSRNHSACLLHEHFK